LNTIDLNWSISNTSYTSLAIDYFIKESNSSFRVNLTSDITKFTIKNLEPGSTLLINISAIILDGSVIGVSNELKAYSS